MKGYGQFCPVAKAGEVIGERWTVLVLRELLCGSHHFGELRRGVPLMSPALLSRRLKALEQAGVLERTVNGRRTRYTLTAAGSELRPVVDMLGIWGQRWARAELEDHELDAGLLMWDIRRNVDMRHFPDRRCVISFDFVDLPGPDGTFWLVGSDREAELCTRDPGDKVDLRVESDLRTLVQVWMGDLALDWALAAGRIALRGDGPLRQSFRAWFCLNPLAGVDRTGATGQGPDPESRLAPQGAAR